MQKKSLLRLASTSAAALVIRIAGALSTFLLTILLSRMLGAEGVGIYFLCLSLLNFVSVGGRLGIDLIALRRSAVLFSETKLRNLRLQYRDSISALT